MGLLMFSHNNRGSGEQMVKPVSSAQGKLLKLLLLMTVVLAFVFCVAYVMFGQAFPGGKAGRRHDADDGFDMADKSYSDTIAMEVIKMQMKSLAGRGVSVCVQQCMSVAGPPCVESGRGLETHDGDEKRVSGRESDGYPLLWRKVRSKTDLGVEGTEQPVEDNGAPDPQEKKDEASDHQAENDGASDRQADNDEALDHKANNDEALDRQANNDEAVEPQANKDEALDRQANNDEGLDRQARRIAAKSNRRSKNQKELSAHGDRQLAKRVGVHNKVPRTGRGHHKGPRMMNFVETFQKSPPLPESVRREDMYYKLAQDDIDLLELAITKANYMPRVALLFLTEGPLRLAPVWESYLRGYEDFYSVYVHQMPRFEFPQNDSQLFAGRVIRSENGEWGRMDMVDAQRRLLANAVMNPLNQRFVLLSDACVPVTDFLFMYHYLIDTSDSFVESTKAGEKDDVDDRGQPIVKREVVQPLSQWFALTRKHAALIVQDRTYYPAFARNCVGIPERSNRFCLPGFSRWCRRGPHVICNRHEQYIQTVIRNLAYHELNQRSVMWTLQEGSWDARAVSWSADKLRANTSLLESIREQRNCQWNGQEKECFLFAHKFTPDAVPLLLQKGKQIGLWRA